MDRPEADAARHRASSAGGAALLNPPAQPAGLPAYARVLLALAALSALYLVADLVTYLRVAPGRDAPLFGDFFAFWSFARFAAENPAAAIYDAPRLQQFQLALDPQFNSFYPFPYPPIFLLVLLPLAGFAYLPAYLIWIGTTLAAYLAAAASGPKPRFPRIALAAVAPSTLFGFISGQNGFLSAALLFGGLHLIGKRPVLGGVLLGALAYKPQMAVLVPVALLAARNWRGLAGAAAMVLALAAICTASFGAGIWRAWVEGFPVYLSLVDANREHLATLMPTVAAALLVLGAPPVVQQGVQLLCALGVLAGVWIVFRNGPRPLAIAFLAVGLFVATPYALVYDLPVLTLAVIAAYETGARAGRAWRPGELIVLFLGLALPVTSMGGAAGPPALAAIGKPAVLLLLLGVIWRIRADSLKA